MGREKKKRKKCKRDAVSPGPACCSVVSSNRGRPKYVGIKFFFFFHFRYETSKIYE